MSLESAFAPAEAKYKAEVMAMTWGHLAPEVGRDYQGKMIFAHGNYGHVVLLDAVWDELTDSPWLHDDMLEYIDQKISDLGYGVFQFDGIYRLDADRAWEFDGSVSRILAVS